MDFTELRDALSTHLNNDQIFSLLGDELGSTSILTALNTYMEDQSLIVTNATLTETEDGALLTGTGGNRPFQGMEVRAAFTIVDEVAELQLTAATDNRFWNLARSYPELRESIFFEVTSSGDQSLVLTSNGFAEDQPPGLSFTGAVELSALMSLLSWLFDGRDHIPLSGPIEIEDGLPMIDLAYPADPAESIDLGFVNLTFGGTLRSLILPGVGADAQGTVFGQLELLAEIAFTAQGQERTLPIRGLFSNRLSPIILQADLNDVIAASLDELAALTDGASLAALMPSDLNLADAFTLQDLTLKVDPVGKRLLSVGLGIQSTGTWPLAPSPLVINEIGAYGTLVDPLGDRKMLLTLFGEIQINENAAIALSASAPDFHFDGELVEGSEIDLREIGEFFLGDLPENTPALRISDVQFSLDTRARTYTALIAADSSESTWAIPLGGDQELLLENIALEVEHSGPGATSGKVYGHLQLGEDRFVVTAAYQGAGAGWNFSIVQDAADPIHVGERLAGLVTLLPGFQLPPALSTLALSAFNLSFGTQSRALAVQMEPAGDWDIPFVEPESGGGGATQFSLSALSVTIDTRHVPGSGRVVTGTVEGTLRLGRNDFRAEINLPGDLVLEATIPSFRLSALVQEICGTGLLQSLPAPARFLETELTNIQLRIATQQRSISLACDSSLGQTEIVLSRAAGGWGMAAGFTVPEGWKLSALDSGLDVLDGLDFGDSTLVVSSSDDSSLDLTTIAVPVGSPLAQGLNFYAQLRTESVRGIQHILPGVDALTVHAAIGNNPQAIEVQASIEGTFPLGDGATLGNPLSLSLRPSPTDFSLTLHGGVNVLVDAQPLRFIGGLEVTAITTPPSFHAELEAAMLSPWVNPLGATGLTINQLALELGVSFPPVQPSIGLAGSFLVGRTPGALAVKINAAQPVQSVVAIAFERLAITDVLSQFCPPEVRTAINQVIPSGSRETMQGIVFNAVSVYIAPVATEIAGVPYKQGINLSGALSILGLSASAQVTIEQTQGLLIRAEVDPLVLDGIFSLTGSGGQGKASLLIDLRSGQLPVIDISGAVELLGLVRDTRIVLQDDRFDFETEGKIFDRFNARLEVHGGNITHGQDFQVTATMQNDLTAFLRDHASQAIQAAANEATKGFDAFETEIIQWSTEVAKLKLEIDKARTQVKNARKAEVNKVQAKITRLQNRVNELDGKNGEIEAARKVVRARRKQDDRALDSAKTDLETKRTAVDSLQTDIKNLNTQINGINKQIQKERAKLLKRPIWERGTADIAFAAWEGVQRTKQGGIYTAIATLETTKSTADFALARAQDLVNTLKRGKELIPVDSDPVVAALKLDRDATQTDLNNARKEKINLEAAHRRSSIDSDPIVAILIRSQNAANGSLNEVKASLNTARAAAGGLASAADFIATSGLGGLIDIHEAGFSALLTAARSGHVTLHVKLSLMNERQPRSLDLNFNFQDPVKGAKDLAKILFP